MKDKIIIRSRFKDLRNFASIPVNRKSVIAESPDSFEGRNYAVNSNAAFLHPSVQYLRIKEVIQIEKDVRTYILGPDVSKGTAKLAYFRPGQFISVTLNIGQAVVTRPFTICSSPMQSTDDEYVITVKKVPEPFGFASAYIFENWVKGTQITASAPAGTFYYQPIRDQRNIVAIADERGSGAFLSMAKSIADGLLDVNMTLIYGCRKKSDAIFMDDFIEISKECENFNAVFVFSDERIDKCERGFITKSIIEKYAPNHKYSVFVNGSPALFNQISPHLASMKFERKYLRFGLNGQINNPSSLEDFPAEAKGKTFLCKVIKSGQALGTIPCFSEETLLVALERAGIEAPSLCRSGECGFCRAKLIKGNVFIPNGTDYRRAVDTKYGIIHPCMSYPMSNLTIIIN